MMKIAVITNEVLKEELLSQVEAPELEIVWLAEPQKIEGATHYLDLLFTNEKERIQLLSSFTSETILVNAVLTTCKDLPQNFVRINGWPSFLNRPVVEAATLNNKYKPDIEKLFSLLGKSVEWTPDTIGFIAARVICMIINEAYYTIQDDVTGKEEIDIAMKLGTRYPFGPFEWSRKIGLQNVYALLSSLATEHKRYEPAEILKQEAQ